MLSSVTTSSWMINVTPPRTAMTHVDFAKMMMMVATMPSMIISARRMLQLMVSARMVSMHALVVKHVTSVTMIANGSNHAKTTWTMNGATPSRIKDTVPMRTCMTMLRNVQRLVDSVKETMMTIARTRNHLNGVKRRKQRENVIRNVLLKSARKPVISANDGLSSLSYCYYHQLVFLIGKFLKCF